MALQNAHPKSAEPSHGRLCNIMRKKLLNLFNITTTNDKLLLTLSFLLFIPLLFDFIFAMTNGNSGIYSIIIYGLSFVVIVFEFVKLVSIKNILIILFLFAIFAFNMVLFPSSQEYFFRPQMFILYGYTIPISFLFLVKINDWSSFFRIMSYFGFISIIMAAKVILYVMSIPNLVQEGVFSYMEFSYALSPMLCALFARYLETNKYIYLVAYIAGMTEIVAYSSRAALIYAILFVFIGELYYFKKRKRRFACFITILIVGVFFSASITRKIENSSYFEASYAINRFISGEGSSSESREYIYKLCRQRINEVGVNVNGFFGDRPFCGSVYPHNLFYEIWMQFGTLIGTIVLLLLCFLIISSFVKCPNKLVVIFFLLTIFAQFLVSGSYLESGKFWVFLCVLISLVRNRKLKRHEYISCKSNLSRTQRI